MKSLNEIPGRNPFKVPENYFDEVNRQIISSTSGNNSEFKVIPMFRKLKPYLAIAALVSGFVLIGYTSLRLIQSNDLDNKVPHISLEYFSESYLNEIDLFTLEENVSAMLKSDEVPEINNSDIIDYLLLENIDVDEISNL
jgi:hypothetical protein